MAHWEAHWGGEQKGILMDFKDQKWKFHEIHPFTLVVCWMLDRFTLGP
jgi:hypothetical protein